VDESAACVLVDGPGPEGCYGAVEACVDIDAVDAVVAGVGLELAVDVEAE
jgi:hypothetical protein